MKRTSRGSRLVRIAAMSPLRSSAGPAMQRMPTPSSSRTMKASDVLPSPGGPTSRTWSSASSLPCAAWSEIASGSLIRSWPTNSPRLRGRSERSMSSSSGLIVGVRKVSLISRRSECQAHALFWRQLGIDPGQCLLGLDERVAELDQRLARHQVLVGAGVAIGQELASGQLLFQLQHDALRRLLA